MNTTRSTFLLLAVLVAITGFIYFFNIHNQLFWDDNDWIVNNPYVHGFSGENIKALFTKNTLAGIGQKSNYYRPFLFLTFATNYAISGIKPLGYHLVNNGLHILNAILVFILVDWLFRKKRMAFLVALLFAVHPLQTEAVTYVSGRGDPLSVTLMLVALLLFIKNRSAKKWYVMALSVLSFVLAMLSREVAAIFPLFIITTAVFLERKPFSKALWNAIKASIPYLVTAGVYALLRLTVFNFKDTLNFYGQNNVYTEHLSYRIYTFLHVLVEYIRLIFAPAHLHMERDVAIATSLFQLPVLLGVVIILGVLGILYYLYKKSDSTKEHSLFNIWFLGWGFFFIWLIPSSGIIPVNAFLYEHWLYFSLIGIFILVAYGIDQLLEYFQKKGNELASFLIIAVLVASVGAFSYISIQRNILWGKPVAFYQDILKYDPESVRIHNNLGNIYYDMGDHAHAEQEYWLAVKSEDIFPQPHFNLGSILQERGDIAGAIIEYEKALKIDPDFPFSYQALAVIYAQQGQYAKAEQNARKLVEIRGADPRVYYNLALVLLAERKTSDAISVLKEGLTHAGKDLEAQKGINDLIAQLSKKK